MPVDIVFETHSTSEDNERGIATGWLPGRLSPTGRSQAAELGDRRRAAGLAVIFTSDLRRAAETAAIAFGGTDVPILHDWRLRECNYGLSNGMPTAELHRDRAEHLDIPYPGGESWRQAVTRVGGVFDDLRSHWDGRSVLMIGHVATRWALDHLINGVPLEALMTADFSWCEGWEYQLG